MMKNKSWRNLFSSQRLDRWSLFLIVALVFVTFYPALNNGFVNFDDDQLVYQNPLIRELSVPGTINIFSSFHYVSYTPLVVLSFAVEHHFFGLDPWIYHLDNLLLHIANCLLVFWFFRLLTKNTFLPFFIALFFGIHPMRVESVAWVTERKDLLYALFYLLSLIAYFKHKYIRQKNSQSYLSLLFFLGSLLSKPMAITLPFVLLLLDYFKGARLTKKLMIQKIPYFILSVIFIVLAFWSGLHNPLVKNESIVSSIAFPGRLLIANHALLFHIAKLLFPFPLSAIYPFPAGIERAIPPTYFLWFGLSLVLATALFTRWHSKEVRFGLLFYFFTILPTLNLVPRLGPDFAADRFTYIPAIGIFYLFLSLIERFFIERNAKLKALALIFLITAIAVSSIMSYQRCGIWKDSETLWSDVLKTYPSQETALGKRGEWYYRNGRTSEALRDYTLVIESHPNNKQAYDNRGTVYNSLGEYALAIENFTNALKIDPKYTLALLNRGKSYLSLREFSKAENDFRSALNTHPACGDCYYNLAIIRYHENDYPQAKQLTQKAQELGTVPDPNFLRMLQRKKIR